MTLRSQPAGGAAEAITVAARSHARCSPSWVASFAVKAASTESAISIPGSAGVIPAACRIASPSPHAASTLQHAAARQRRDQALASLREVERDFDSAEGHYDKAKQASRAAAGLVKEAKAQLKRG